MARLGCRGSACSTICLAGMVGEMMTTIGLREAASEEDAEAEVLAEAAVEAEAGSPGAAVVVDNQKMEI